MKAKEWAGLSSCFHDSAISVELSAISAANLFPHLRRQRLADGEFVAHGGHFGEGVLTFHVLGLFRTNPKVIP